CVFILCLSAVCRLVRQLACSCLFPYTTLFRSYFHHLPPWAHKAEVVANHITQLIVPFALFAPQPVASVAAGVVIVTQGWLVLSGDRKSTRLNASHVKSSYAVFCLKKKQEPGWT